jgi:dihydroorotate dehydrogenase electron transfer subunit
MDGSMGFQGDVLGLFKDSGLVGCDGIYACGPKGMLIDLAETIDRKKYRTFQVSLEERMACGVGACRGCVVEAALPAGSYLTVCRDGPVFEAGEIAWKRLAESTWQWR